MVIDSQLSLKRPYTVVLTGGIACGKTAISKSFEKLGVPVIDTDTIARDLVQPGSNALTSIIETFGKFVLLEDGTLNRKLMRKLIFENSHKRYQLEQILHPEIENAVIEIINGLRSAYCILVVPLYFQSDSYKWADHILVVDVPEDVQIARLTKRDNLNISEAISILEAQTSRLSRIAGADSIIDNSGGISELEEKIKKTHQMLLKQAET